MNISDISNEELINATNIVVSELLLLPDQELDRVLQKIKRTVRETKEEIAAEC